MARVSRVRVIPAMLTAARNEPALDTWVIHRDQSHFKEEKKHDFDILTAARALARIDSARRFHRRPGRFSRNWRRSFDVRARADKRHNDRDAVNTPQFGNRR